MANVLNATLRHYLELWLSVHRKNAVRGKYAHPRMLRDEDSVTLAVTIPRDAVSVMTVLLPLASYFYLEHCVFVNLDPDTSARSPSCISGVVSAIGSRITT